MLKLYACTLGRNSKVIVRKMSLFSPWRHTYKHTCACLAEEAKLIQDLLSLLCSPVLWNMKREGDLFHFCARQCPGYSPDAAAAAVDRDHVVHVDGIQPGRAITTQSRDTNSCTFLLNSLQ